MNKVRRFEFHDYGNNSHKFWELHLKGGCYHTEYGRLPGFGRAGSRSKSGQKCDSSYHRAAAKKIRKGYVEVNPTSSQAYQKMYQDYTSSPASSSVQPSNTPLTVSAKVGLLNWSTL